MITSDRQPEPTARPRPLPVGRVALVGRETELATLEAALDDARQATGIVLLCGEPGVGKSRLLEHLANRAAGWRILRGGAYEAQGQPPYVLFVETLRSFLDQAGAGAERQRARRRLREFGRILPEWNARTGQRGTGDRQRLMELAAHFFRSLAHEQPLLLLLDDLHWADAASLDLLAYLGRRLRDVPLFVLAAYRDTDVDEDHLLRRLVADLHRRRLVEEIHLRRLSSTGTVGLLQGLLGGPITPDLAALVQRRSEGNPFFVEELARALADDGRLHLSRDGWELADCARESDETVDLPPSLRTSLWSRLGRLSPACLALLEAAALLGRRIEPAILASTAGSAAATTAQLLGEAARKHVLIASGTAYEFAHDQLRAALDQGINPRRRQRLHDRAAAAYRSLGLASQRPAALAYHLLRGSQPADARPYLVSAGRRALDTFAYQDAVDHLSKAAELAREAASEEELAGISASLGEALFGGGHYDDALAAYRSALNLPAVQPDQFFAGRIEARIGEVHLAREETELALAAHRRALDAFGTSDHEEAARALLQLGELNIVAFSRHADGARQARRALKMAERLAGPTGRNLASRLMVDASGLLGTAQVRMGRPSGVATLEKALGAALRLQDDAMAGKIANRLAQHHYWSAELEQAARAARQALRLLRGVADPHLFGWPTFWLGLVAFTRGEWTEACQRADELIELGEQLGVRRFLAQGHQIHGMVAQDLSRWPAALEHLGQSARLLRSIAPGTLVFYLGRYCLALLDSGASAEGEACLAELEGLAGQLPAGAKPRNSSLNLVALCYLKLGRADDRQRLELELRSAAGQLHWTLVARALGELALARHDPAAAKQYLGQAAALAARAGARPELARTWRAAARLERASAGPGASSRAAALDHQAAQLEQSLGLFFSPAPPAASAPGPALSPRELEVLALLATGRTNRQIAEALSISERTAVHHVTHIFDKLDLPSRAAAAAYALRHGLVDEQPAPRALSGIGISSDARRGVTAQTGLTKRRPRRLKGAN